MNKTATALDAAAERFAFAMREVPANRRKIRKAQRELRAAAIAYAATWRDESLENLARVLAREGETNDTFYRAYEESGLKGTMPYSDLVDLLCKMNSK